jgi:PAS domain-containing protein
VVAAEPATGRIPLAVTVIDGAGLIAHWNADAHRLFDVPAEDAVGRRAVDVLPASSSDELAMDHRPEDDPAFDGIAHLDPDGRMEILFGSDTTDLTVPSSGRYWTQARSGERGPRDVLWWAYPLLGPGGARLLLLAADGTRLAAADGPARQAQGFGPAFVRHTEFDRSDELAERLPGILPRMGERESGRIAEQVLRVGYPALEITGRSRLPVTPDWGG